MAHFKLPLVENIVGFNLETARKGEKVKVLTRLGITSDESDFYNYIDQISGSYFSTKEFPVLINSVSNFLIIIHKDLSADVYFNDFPIQVEIRIKGNINKGEIIRDSQISDIRRITFPNVSFEKTDKVFCCLKVGWKFFFYFDLHREESFDENFFSKELAHYYRYLSFKYVYEIFESDSSFNEMLVQGWFPFVEIMGNELKHLKNVFKDNSSLGEELNKFIDKFDQGRIEKIVAKWWNKESFKKRKSLLTAGIDAFLQNTQSGFINCIKTLISEIEGICVDEYFKEKQTKRIKGPKFIKNLIEKGKKKSGSEHSLIFPQKFFEYLDKGIYANFDPDSNEIKLSRHSSLHGNVSEEEYTKEKALQIILSLDQIYYYVD